MTTDLISYADTQSSGQTEEGAQTDKAVSDRCEKYILHQLHCCVLL